MEGHPFRMIAKYIWTAAPVLLAVAVLVPASSVYYTATGGECCAG